MNILLLGSGGREHALAWKLSQSPNCTQLFIAPGNPGTAQFGKNLSFSVTDFDAITNCCIHEKIDMVIVGPEEPLVKGIYDHLRINPALKQLLIIGPSQYGAQLEGSKAFAKAFMQRHNIPTAAYKEFTLDNYAEGVQYIQQHNLPIVLKADGLAAGKGVVICQTHIEAMAEFELMIQQAKFGDASKKVVVEEFLSGIELSVFALTDGEHYVLLPNAKDYKRIGEGDTGLNTGGMGAISPVPLATPAFMQKVEEQIVKPTIKGLHSEKINFTGFVFIGLISVNDNPYVIEYNCRMGDPETEVVLPRLQNDLVDLLTAAANKQLATQTINTDPRAAATIVAVSAGYPGSFEKGFVISGHNENYGKQSIVFQAGTTEKEGEVVTNGGRVLCITSYANDIQEAVNTSLDVLSNINYEGITYRTDIGYEFK